MNYQITLTPEEYMALSAAARQQGKTIELVIHEALAERLRAHPAPAPARKMSEQTFLEHLHAAGIISIIPTREPDTPTQAAERERLASSISPGKPLSETVIEDRGPR